MGWYDDKIIPHLVKACCAASSIDRQRAKVVPRATGRVLEIGLGPGFNLAHYDRDRVEAVVGLDPNRVMTAEAMSRAEQLGLPLQLVDWEEGRIPECDAAFDSVVVTYSLCSIPEIEGALREVRRVLKPGGELLFSEHGLAPDRRVAGLQRAMNPVWRIAGGGCNLDRDVPALLRRGGFEVPWLETLYLPGVRFLNYHYWGAAR